MIVSISKQEFIFQSFPDILEINPLTDRYYVGKVKDYLIKYGFYAKDHEMLETAVCNLILRMQGKYLNRMAVNGRNRK